jgi:hypothetical protein
MAEPVAVLAIKDFLLNKQPRQVELYRGQLFLTAIINPKEGLASSAKIGVVEGGGMSKDESKKKFGPYVTLSPYYENKKDSILGLITATRIPKNDYYLKTERVGEEVRVVRVPNQVPYKNSFYAHAFNTIWNGNAQHISESLRHQPFEGLELLADKIGDFDVPYGDALEQLFENPAFVGSESV